MKGCRDHIDCLKIEDREWRKIVGQLQREARQDQRSMMKRKDQRMLYTNAPKIHVAFAHPGGSEANFTARPYNLSRGGMAILHGQYVHQGTIATLTLQKLVSGETEQVSGSVVSCRLVRGNIHEIGVKFDFPIELEEFVSETAAV